MSLVRILRDDEEIRCVSPQRLAPSSRVLPFPSSARVLSHADYMCALEAHDPTSAAMIRRVAEQLYHRLPDAAKG